MQNSIIWFICGIFLLPVPYSIGGQAVSLFNGELHVTEETSPSVSAVMSDDTGKSAEMEQRTGGGVIVREDSVEKVTLHGQQGNSFPMQMSGFINLLSDFPNPYFPTNPPKKLSDFMNGFMPGIPLYMRGMAIDRQLLNRPDPAFILCQQAVELAMQYQETDEGKNKIDIKEKLKRVLAQLFEQMLVEKERDIERLKKEIQIQERLVSESKQQKVQFIEKRLDKMIGDEEKRDF